MVKFNYLLNRLTDRLTATFHQEEPVNVFCKALYVFLVLKIVFGWGASVRVLAYFPVKISTSWIGQVLYFPASLANVSFSLFAILFLTLLITSLAIKRNYFTAILIFWFNWNYYKIDFLSSNGSDYILLMLVFLSIPMSSYPRANDGKHFFFQKVGHNAALALCQIQVALIYLVSGIDKIRSEIWTSGDAIQYVDRLSFMANPNLSHLLPPGELLPFILAWLTILYELGFSLLVWFKEFRLFVLISGVIFHLIIAVFLSLPDFGLIMIIAYIPFLTTMATVRKKKQPPVALDSSWIKE